MPVTLAVRLPKEEDKRPNHELENKMQDCISKGDTSMSKEAIKCQNHNL